MTHQPFLLPLRGPIKTYDWGSRTVLAGLAGRDAPAAEPEAELWLGAHPQGVAEVASGGAWVSLRDAIERSPAELLGAHSVERFGVELPFLLKVLAIERPLSLQAHPDSAQAAAGFARERAAGVVGEDGSYRDPRHKPELIVALEPLWLLRGLLEPSEIRRRFADARIESLDRETGELARRGVEGLRAFLAALLGVTGETKRQVLDEARRAVAGNKGSGSGVGEQLVCSPGRADTRSAPTSNPGRADTRSAPTSDQSSRESRLHWLGRLLELHPDDPAALAPLFMHVVHLAPGQGIFQPPRMLHSYLQGAGVEVMASSDNVVRAGLTTKRVDVDEVLAVADLTPSMPSPIEPRLEGGGVARYSAAAEEFELLRLEPAAARDGGTESMRVATLESPTSLLIGICTHGAGRVEAPDRGEGLDLASGSAFALRPGAGDLRVFAPAAGELSLYVAAVPSPRP